MPVTYPLDLTGVAPSNYIANEIHTVSESNFRDYFFIVPNLSPFYTDNFSATITVGSSTRTLVEDVDFSFALPYVSATRITGKAVYGAITLHGLDNSGILQISYQTVGGDQVADRLEILTFLADKAYNPRTTIWDIITARPQYFPPYPQHPHEFDNFLGQDALVQKLGEIRDAILTNTTDARAQIQQLIDTILSGTASGYVKKIGDTMTGPLILNGPPNVDLQAATKRYVDDQIASLSSALSDHSYVDNRISELSAALMSMIINSGVDHEINNIKNDIQNIRNQLNSSNTSVAYLQSYIDDKIAEVMARINSL